MSDQNHPSSRDALDFLPRRLRPVPVVEEPSRLPEIVMTALYLGACVLAALLIFSA